MTRTCVLFAGLLLFTFPAEASEPEPTRWATVGVGGSVIFPLVELPVGSTLFEVAAGTHTDTRYGLVFFGHEIQFPPAGLGYADASCFVYWTSIEPRLRLWLNPRWPRESMAAFVLQLTAGTIAPPPRPPGQREPRYTWP